MQSNWAKPCLVVSVIITLALLAGFIAEQAGKGGGGRQWETDVVWFRCTRPECGNAFSLKLDDFARLREQEADLRVPGKVIGEMGEVVVTCPKCNEHTAHGAMKCRKCGEVFVMGTAESARFSDTCPKCGYSITEETMKK